MLVIVVQVGGLASAKGELKLEKLDGSFFQLKSPRDVKRLLLEHAVLLLFCFATPLGPPGRCSFLVNNLQLLPNDDSGLWMETPLDGHSQLR